VVVLRPVAKRPTYPPIRYPATIPRCFLNQHSTDEELAERIVSDAGRFVTGATIVADGGQSVALRG
jgi:hypothetical protein